MKKIKCFLEKAETYVNEHRWCSILINILYVVTYFISLLAIVVYSIALLSEDINPQNIVTVVLAFSVLNTIFYRLW